jgi:chromosome segregation ATPase
MSSVCRTLLLASIAASPAFATTALDGLRASARESTQRVADLRARQSALKKQLDNLAPQIESLKNQGGLIPGNELKSQLRRSQELSGQLTEVAQSLAAAQVEAQRRSSQLADALSAELQRLESAWDQSHSRGDRERLRTQIRALQAERDQVRASMPIRTLPSIEPTRTSEEPEALLQQVDSLRDAEDKVRQQLQSVDKRIGEVREEQALDRRMRDFMNEQSLFDDQDRRFRNPESGGSASSAFGGQSPTSGPTSPSSTPPDVRPTEKPPQVENASRSTFEPADSLEALESQRGKLQNMAQQLHDRAQQLEQRAKSKEQHDRGAQ